MARRKLFSIKYKQLALFLASLAAISLLFTLCFMFPSVIFYIFTAIFVSLLLYLLWVACGYISENFF
jgi:hypothetical protein